MHMHMHMHMQVTNAVAFGSRRLELQVLRAYERRERAAQRGNLSAWGLRGGRVRLGGWLRRRADGWRPVGGLAGRVGERAGVQRAGGRRRQPSAPPCHRRHVARPMQHASCMRQALVCVCLSVTLCLAYGLTRGLVCPGDGRAGEGPGPSQPRYK